MAKPTSSVSSTWQIECHSEWTELIYALNCHVYFSITSKYRLQGDCVSGGGCGRRWARPPPRHILTVHWILLIFFMIIRDVLVSDWEWWATKCALFQDNKMIFLLSCDFLSYYLARWVFLPRSEAFEWLTACFVDVLHLPQSENIKVMGQNP